MMRNTIQAVYLKNRLTVKRAYPWSFIMQRIIGGILSTCFPLFIYYYIFDKTLSNTFQQFTNTRDYITYIILGRSIHILAFATLMNVGRCMITEIREGTLDIFLLSPASRWGYFIGTYIEQFLRSIFEFLVIIIVGVGLGAKIRFEKIPLICILILFISLSCFSLAMIISSIMVFTRDTFLTQNTIITLLSLISGVVFPIELLPSSLQLIARGIPITHGLQLFRNCILAEESLSRNIDSIITMFGLSFLYLIIGFLWFKRLESKLIEEIYS
jgi:ABC-2 type transport system permease protein